MNTISEIENATKDILRENKKTYQTNNDFLNNICPIIRKLSFILPILLL